MVKSGSDPDFSNNNSLGAVLVSLRGNIQIHKECEMVQYVISVEKFGSLDVYNDNEEPVKLSSLWLKETAVLVFVRHFG
jgi:hypothetical protein